MSIGNGRFNDAVHRQSRYRPSDNVQITREQIVEIVENLYMVESVSDPDKCYSVDIKSNYCECVMGQLHGPCKHKQSISHHFGIAEFSVLPTADNKARAMYHYIATGVILQDSFYRDLDNPTSSPNISQYVEQRR